MAGKKVLVLGASGHFGRLLVDDLRRFSDCEVVTPDRRAVDLCDPASLESALRGVSIAICAAGPFQTFPTTIAELCLRRGIHYIDFADDRAFARKIRSLVPLNDPDVPAVCSGWSTVSALSGLLTQIAASGLGAIDAIYIHMAPGNRGGRSTGTIASLLHSVGTPFKVFHEDEWRAVHGWSEARIFTFPPPIGPRRGYLVDVPDHDLFPALFQARTVEFRAASELRLLNLGVTWLSWFVRIGLVRDWVPWNRSLQRIAALLQSFGHDWGGVGVEVAATYGRRRVCMMADHAGQRIAVMPASVIAGLLSAGVAYHGLVSPAHWLTYEQLQLECSKRDFQLIVEDL